MAAAGSESHEMNQTTPRRTRSASDRQRRARHAPSGERPASGAIFGDNPFTRSHGFNQPTINPAIDQGPWPGGMGSKPPAAPRPAGRPPREDRGTPLAAASERLALLLRLRPGLAFCASARKDAAAEAGWQLRKRRTIPAQWRDREWFAIQPHSAGVYLVDLDSVTDEARMLARSRGKAERGRKPSLAEARELAGRLGGRPLIYESTIGQGKYHLLYPAIPNGGADRNLASQSALVRLGSGRLAAFDLRGGGVFPEGHHRAGRQCGCRIDADARRIGMILSVLEDSTLRPPRLDRLEGALATKRRLTKRVANARRPPLKAGRRWTAAGARPKVADLAPYGGGGVHDYIIAQTLRIADWAEPGDRKRLLGELERTCEGLPRESPNGNRNLSREIRSAYAGALRRVQSRNIEHAQRGDRPTVPAQETTRQPKRSKVALSAATVATCSVPAAKGPTVCRHQRHRVAHRRNPAASGEQRGGVL